MLTTTRASHMIHPSLCATVLIMDRTRSHYLNGNVNDKPKVPETASSLNSGDSFVLLTPEDVYLWVGNGCSPEEAKASEEISQVRVRLRMVPPTVAAFVRALALCDSRQ